MVVITQLCRGKERGIEPKPGLPISSKGVRTTALPGQLDFRFLQRIDTARLLPRDCYCATVTVRLLPLRSFFLSNADWAFVCMSMWPPILRQKRQ